MPLSQSPLSRPDGLAACVRALGLLGAVAAATIAAPASAQPPVPARDHTFSLHAPHARLDMLERSSRLIELPDSVTHVLDFDQQVLGVEAVSDRQVRVTAMAPGVTTIVFLDQNGVSRELEIFVTGDTRYLTANLRQLFPSANIEAIQIGETGEAVVLRGWVTDPAHVPEIVDVAKEFYPEIKNQLRTATNERVLLEVKILEVNRTKLREFGFEWFNFGSTVRAGSAVGAFDPLTLDNDVGGLTILEQTLNAPNLGIQILKPSYQFFGFLQALQTESLAKILAEPKLVTTSGRPATLLSGGEFPILVPQGVGTTSIEFREYGVRVEAVPVVLGNNRLRLDIAPEVSERDFASAVNVQGIQVPGLTTRRVNTGAELSFGETLMLGGLVSTRDVGSTRKVPFLGELPFIGMAFSRKTYSQSETELLIMVTPYPAAALPDGAMPCGPGLNTTFPTDKELYIDGLLELPNYGDPCGNTNVNCGPPMMMHGVGKGGSCGVGCSTCGPTYAGPAVGGASMMTGGPVIQGAPMVDSGVSISPQPTYSAPTYPADAYNPPATIETIDQLAPGSPMIEAPMHGPVPTHGDAMPMRFDSPEPIPADPNVEGASYRPDYQSAGRQATVMQTSMQTAASPTPQFGQARFEQPTFSQPTRRKLLPTIRPKNRPVRESLQFLKSSY